LNLITEAEKNSKVLENLRKLLRGLPGKIINPPEAVLRSTRDQVARRLAGISGLIVPRAIRLRKGKPGLAIQAIEQAGLSLPIILRQVGTHTGKIVGLFDRVDQIQAELGSDDEHIATEFVDFRSSDGLYRKFRVFCIGRQIVFRHLLISDDWNVHGKDRGRFMADRPDLIDEERAMFGTPEGAFSPKIRQVISAVRERIALDFFGMDFGIAPDGRVLLFEANATMNFFSPLPGPQFNYLRACIAPAQLAFRELLGLEPTGVMP
jgi:glutathione synthase/RimK-type ligase-like ATP-grasp enzyme